MVWVCYGETISHRRSTVPIVSIFFCFHFRWRLSSYFPCVNSLPYNWRYSKRKWPNEKALMFLSHRVSFLQISRNGIRTGENANSRISSFTSTPSGDICPLHRNSRQNLTSGEETTSPFHNPMRALRMLHSLKRNKEWDALRWQRRITSCLLARSWVGNEGNNLKSMGRLLVLLYILEN